MDAAGYGLPLKCPSCDTKSYYGCLKFSGSRTMKCEKHGAVYELTPNVICRVKVGSKADSRFCGQTMTPTKASCSNCGTRLVPSHPREG
jgi:hypothetical protein